MFKERDRVIVGGNGFTFHPKHIGRKGKVIHAVVDRVYVLEDDYPEGVMMYWESELKLDVKRMRKQKLKRCLK